MSQVIIQQPLSLPSETRIYCYKELALLSVIATVASYFLGGGEITLALAAISQGFILKATWSHLNANGMKNDKDRNKAHWAIINMVVALVLFNLAYCTHQFLHVPLLPSGVLALGGMVFLGRAAYVAPKKKGSGEPILFTLLVEGRAASIIASVIILAAAYFTGHLLGQTDLALGLAALSELLILLAARFHYKEKKEHLQAHWTITYLVLALLFANAALIGRLHHINDMQYGSLGGALAFSMLALVTIHEDEKRRERERLLH